MSHRIRAVPADVVRNLLVSEVVSLSRLFASPYAERKNLIPILSRSTELAHTLHSDLIEYRLGDEELERYRSLPPPKRLLPEAKWSNAALRKWRS